MSKTKVMLKSFLSVMCGNKEQIKMMIPNYYAKSVYSINYQELYQRGIVNLIFDIDNTILPVNDIKVDEKLVKLFVGLIADGFNICIVSNNSVERVNPVAEKLKVISLSNADKPKKEAFDKALKLLESDVSSTAMIGDQMLTDIKGANEYGLCSILVDPLLNKYDFKTGTSRILQNIMELKLKRENKFIKHKYY